MRAKEIKNETPSTVYNNLYRWPRNGMIAEIESIDETFGHAVGFVVDPGNTGYPIGYRSASWAIRYAEKL